MIRRSERCARWRAVCALALFAALAAPAAAQRGEREVKIAVLPVVVHAMEQQDYLRSGLGDMLASRLGQHSGLAVLRMEDPARATTDSETAQAAGRAAGADWVLFGSFTQFGTGASLDLRCLPASGRAAGPRSIFTQSGSLGEIIPRLANVAARIAAHIKAGPVVEQESLPDLQALQGVVETLRGRVEALESTPTPAPRRPATAASPLAGEPATVAEEPPTAESATAASPLAGEPPAVADEPPTAESAATVAGALEAPDAPPADSVDGEIAGESPPAQSPGVVADVEREEAPPDAAPPGNLLAGERAESAEGS
ncbi:MAG: hypothetical protein OXU53_05615 [Deltaproteobacteria bacterium]|nr:hypothetical protein [Deltaproteobacteria bacterium]